MRHPIGLFWKSRSAGTTGQSGQRLIRSVYHVSTLMLFVNGESSALVSAPTLPSATEQIGGRTTTILIIDDHRCFCRIACGRPGYRARYELRRNRHHCSRRNFPSGRTQAHGGRDRHPHAGSRRALRQPPHSRGLAEFVDRGGHRIHRTRMDLAGSTGGGLRVHPQGRLAQRDDRCAQSHPGRPDAGRPVDVQCCPATDPECVRGHACPR